MYLRNITHESRNKFFSNKNNAIKNHVLGNKENFNYKNGKLYRILFFLRQWNKIIN